MLRKEVQDETSPTSSCTGWLPIAPPNPLSTLLCAPEEQPARITPKSTLALWLPAEFSHQRTLVREWMLAGKLFNPSSPPRWEGPGHVSCRAALSASP